MTEQTYTNRNTEIIEIRSISNDGTTLTDDDGWSMFIREEARGKIEVGKLHVREKQGFNRITGLVPMADRGRDDAWLWRDSDQDIEAEEAEWRRKDLERRREFLEKNRADMEQREAALPEVLRKRLENFRTHGGENFDLKGWGYELAVCELTMLYHQSNGEESDEITSYATEHGTSGNQHNYAHAAARLMGTDRAEELATSVSALSPITGDPYYAGEK